MTPARKKIAEVRERTEKNASLRSDDFGHDCQALLVAESSALQVAAGDLDKLYQALELALGALDVVIKSDERLPDFSDKPGTVAAYNARAKNDEVMSE